MVFKPEITNWKKYERKRKISSTINKFKRKLGKPLCKLGLHQYGKGHYQTHFESNIQDYKRACNICGKKKNWVKVKKN